MKVLMLGNYPIGKEMGGVAIHTVNLIKSIGKLENKDLEIYMISFGKESSTFNEGKSKIKIIKAYNIYYMFPPLALYKLNSEIKKLNPQVVHIQGSNSSPYLLYALFYLSKVSKIITVHGLVSIEGKYKKGLKKNILRSLNIVIEKYALSQISTVIVCSPYMRQQVSKMTNSNIEIIPNGIDFEYIQNNQKIISLKYPSILYVGLLNEIKGVNILLRAMELILKTVPGVHLYIAGSGPQEKELKRLAEKLNIANFVTFLGFIPSPQKYWYYKSAEICVFPSMNEAFGIVLLEAMSCGKALVASNVGGIPYVVDDGKTGLLSKPGDFEDLAQKVITLLKNEEFRTRIGNAGVQRAKQFDWDLIAVKTCEIYKNVLKSK